MRIEIDSNNYNSLVQIIENSGALQENEKKLAKELATKILNQPHGGVGVSGRFSYLLQKINDSRIQFHVGENHQCRIVIDQNQPKITELGEVNARDQYGKTKLANAIMDGKKEVFYELLQQKGIDLELADRDGWTLLYRTLVAGNNEMFIALLEKGVSINTKNDVGSRALHIAADRNNVEAVKMLLDKGAKVNVLNIRGTPLLYAVAKGNEETVKLLLEHEADPNLVTDTLTPSPLWVAQNMKNDRLVAILEAKGAELYPSKEDSSHLERLIKNGTVAEIQRFIDDSPNMEDQHKRTPLIYAAWYGRSDVIEMLLKSSADVNHADNAQKSALHYAVIAGHKDIVEKLLKANADVGQESVDKYTPLHWCAQYYDRLEIAQLLIENGADHLAQDKYGWTPFHKCAETGNLPVMQWLVEEKKMPINALHGNGLTALHRAVINNRTDVEAYLKENGIDDTIKDKTGKTAEDYRKK